MAQLQIAPYGRTSRTPRRPQHTFAIEARPWQLVPFFIAPVLPGETMKNMLFQARIVSDPIKNPLIGWWAEFFFWYVKHRDLNEPSRSQLTRTPCGPARSASSGVREQEEPSATGSVERKIGRASCRERV